MLSWTAFVLSTLGLYLNAKKRIECWFVWNIANLLWAFHTYSINEWASFATWIVFICFNTYGYFSWKKSA